MRRLFIAFAALLFLPLLACAQTVYDSPQTVAWDGSADADGYEIMLREWTGNEVTLGTTTELSYYIDLGALNLFGWYEVRVRAYRDDETPMGTERLYSDYISSLNIDDVAVDTFYIVRRRGVGVPGMLRIQ